MKLLVTGGAGFIGSNFIRHWLSKYPEDKIVNFDALTYAGHLENLKDLEEDPNYQFVKGDIRKEDDVSKAIEGVDVVVHFAAESHVDRSIVGPKVFLETNVIGTQVVLDQALEKRVKLFYQISTDEVFGSLPLEPKTLKFNEETPYSPRTPYSASKASSDHLVRAYHETYGLPVVISNCSNNYGPYQDPEKFVARFITNLLEGEKVPLMGKGENVRDWIYVLDHARAIEMIIQAALKDPKIIGQTFCVGGDSERTNLEVTKEILKLLGKGEEMIEHVEHRLGHDLRYAIDSSKIKNTLGWGPEYSFEEALAKTVDWYKQNDWWWKPLKEGRPIVDRVAQKSY